MDADITNLLKAWGAGDQAALDQLSKCVYDELRLMARRHMKNERQGNTLQTTALVHEVYLRLIDVTKVEWQQRAQFFAMAAQMMRRILVDAARARASHKRGAGAVHVNFDETAVVSPSPIVPWSRSTTHLPHSRKSRLARPKSWNCAISAD